VACRTVRPQRELLRIVRTPDGRMTVDPSGRVAGRGAYVCRTAECMRSAIDKGALTRALKVATPAELGGELATMIHVNEGGARGQE